MSVDIRTEIELIKKYEDYGIVVIKGKEKLVINTYKKGLYIELSSICSALDVSMNKLLEDISYTPSVRGHLAYYRDENKVIRVIDFECINPFIRNLLGAGYDVELLRTIREEILKTVEQMEKGVNAHGKN